MAYAHHIRNERTVTVLHLIDAGAHTIPAIVAAAAHDGRLDDRAVRWIVSDLKRKGVIDSTSKACTGRPAVYALTMPLAEAVELVSPKVKAWGADALTAAWAMPVALPEGTARVIDRGGWA